MKDHNNGSSSSFLQSLAKRFRRADLDLAPYRRLALQLHYALPRPAVSRSVLVVAPTSTEQAAYASTVLAQTLGDELRQPVLLADASPHDPDMTRSLGCTANAGFTDCIIDPDRPFVSLLLATSDPNVSFLPVGRRTSALNPPTAEQVTPFLKAATDSYGFLVLSGGSVLSNPMAPALAPHVGSVLLLAVENRTRISDLETAEEALAMCNAAKVALVFTTEVHGSRLRRPESVAISAALAPQPE